MALTPSERIWPTHCRRDSRRRALRPGRRDHETVRQMRPWMAIGNIMAKVDFSGQRALGDRYPRRQHDPRSTKRTSGVSCPTARRGGLPGRRHDPADLSRVRTLFHAVLRAASRASTTSSNYPTNCIGGCGATTARPVRSRSSRQSGMLRRGSISPHSAQTGNGAAAGQMPV
jgi:hypothetical protein